MNFGEAIEALKAGKRVARSGWNGKGMFIYLIEGTEVPVSQLRGAALEHVGHSRPPFGTEQKINGHIDMLAADGSIVVGWLASQTDMLAEDWVVV